jgi:hypothetical protein
MINTLMTYLRSTDHVKGMYLIIQAWILGLSTNLVNASEVAENLKPVFNDLFFLSGTVSAIYGMYKLSKKKDK